MKAAILIAIVLVTLSSLPFACHPSDATVQGNVTGQEGTRGHAQEAPSRTVAQIESEDTELISRVDSNSAQVGDLVIARTKQTVTTADGTQVPKGSRILGRIAEGQAREANPSDPAIRIVFDRALLPRGTSIPVRSVMLLPATQR
jgi:type IV secretory pathway VirB10-like protein